MNEMVKTVEVLTATKNLTWISSRFQHTRGIFRITLTVRKLPLKQHHVPHLKLFLCNVRGVTHIGTNMLSSQPALLPKSTFRLPGMRCSNDAITAEE